MLHGTWQTLAMPLRSPAWHLETVLLHQRRRQLRQIDRVKASTCIEHLLGTRWLAGGEQLGHFVKKRFHTSRRVEVEEADRPISDVPESMRYAPGPDHERARGGLEFPACNHRPKLPLQNVADLVSLLVEVGRYKHPGPHHVDDA